VVQEFNITVLLPTVIIFLLRTQFATWQKIPFISVSFVT